MIEKLIAKHLKNFEAKKILDLGPGYNRFARVAAVVTHAKEIIYLDCNQDVLDWQVKESEKEGLKSQAFFGIVTTEDLEHLNEQFDLILCQEILEHLTNAEEILKTLSKKLSPNGRILITVPTKFSEKWMKFLNSNYMKNEEFGHVRQFSKKDLVKIISESNLTSTIMKPCQPHYFLVHSWIFLSRMKVEGATGKIITQGVRKKIADFLFLGFKFFFKKTSLQFWSYLFPRNYFVIVKLKD